MNWFKTLTTIYTVPKKKEKKCSDDMNSSEPDITRTINYYKDIYQNQCYLEFFFTSIYDGDTQKTLNIYL